MRIAAARVKHMSNSKWRKLFGTIRSRRPILGGITFKLIKDERHFTSHGYTLIPGPEFDCDDNFGECGGLSYTPFAHIEFVYIPNRYKTSPYGPKYDDVEYANDIIGLIALLNQIGKFPIETFESGVKILGYEWD